MAGSADRPDRGAPALSDPDVSTFAPLRVPAYRRLWAAAVVSNLGTFLQLVAGPWVMHELTGSPLQVALVTAALTLPRLLFALPAGSLADSIDRRLLLVIGHVSNALVVLLLAGLTATGRLTPELLLGLSFVIGTGTALSMPAYQTLVPDLVPRPLVPAAVTLNSAGFNVARAIGPAIGGAMVAVGLEATAFALNGVSYLAVVIVLLTYRSDQLAPGERAGVWRGAITGLAYVRFTRPIRTVLLVVAAFALTSASVQALLPSVASDDLGLGADGFGILLGLFGTGALVGAATRERVRTRLRGHVMAPAAITLYGIAGVVFGLSRVPAISAAALAVAGLAWVWTLTTLNATVQLLAPGWVRGRMMSLYVLAVSGMQPIGASVAGGLAESIGPGVAVAALTSGTVVLGLLAPRVRLPILGEIVEPSPPEDWTVPTHQPHVSGSPVVVVTTWEIDPTDAATFSDLLGELRRQRYRTGARRWELYRDADRPWRLTEVFQVADWEEHLRQHARIDEEAAGVIRRARAYDRTGGPETRHLVGVDVRDPDVAAVLEAEVLARHADLHAADGSVPLRGADRRPTP